MSNFNQNMIHHMIGPLNLAVELGNVSKARKVMGLSRNTFYRYQKAAAEGGIEALFEANRRKTESEEPGGRGHGSGGDCLCDRATRARPGAGEQRVAPARYLCFPLRRAFHLVAPRSGII